jgi:hypothetical protein
MVSTNIWQIIFINIICQVVEAYYPSVGDRLLAVDLLDVVRLGVR